MQSASLQKKTLKGFQKQGFSSQDDAQDNILTTRIQSNLMKDQQEEIKHRKKALKALSKVEPPSEIKTKQYSLEPDMINGWKPRFYIAKPIPLTFFNEQLDYSIDTLIKLKTYMKDYTQNPSEDEGEKYHKNFIELIYLGPRYESTYSAWYQKPFAFPYTHLNENKRLRFTDREFVGQYWYSETEHHLRFDSFFESGNLDVVFKVDQFEYELFMRVDANTRGHLQWYNFKVKNMKPNQKYKFSICNFTKNKSLYTRGMKPFVLSLKKFHKERIGWRQQGQDVSYEKKVPKTFIISKTSSCSSSKSYRLSFEYINSYENDQVQFSYCVPYEYSRLKLYISDMLTKYSDKNFIKSSKLCSSLGGLEIPILTITKDLKEKENEDDDQFQKKLIFVQGRIHPGQSNGSYMVEGLINFICSNSQESEYLRSNMVFKIVPMINPDGVVIGNYRTSLSGKDLNRQFIDPDEFVFPQIYHLKKKVQSLKAIYKDDFLMFLDLHGHSTKKNIFTYGPEYPITNLNYYESKVLPKIISMKSDMFRFFSCIFKIAAGKQKTCRGVFQRETGIKLVYTVQASNGCYYNRDSFKDVMFGENSWLKMGQVIGESLNKYALVLSEIYRIRLKKMNDRQRLKQNKIKAVRKNLAKNKTLSKSKLDKTALNSNDSMFIISPIKLNKNSQRQRERQMHETKHNFFNDSDLTPFSDDNVSPFLVELYYQKQNGDDSCFSFLKDKVSDDEISEGGSDSSTSSQDYGEQFKNQLFKTIKDGRGKIFSLKNSRRQARYMNSRTETSEQYSESSKSEMISQSMEKSIVMKDQEKTPPNEEDKEKLDDIKVLSSKNIQEIKCRKFLHMRKKPTKQIILTPSPQKIRTYEANIVNFEFALEPIVPHFETLYSSDRFGGTTSTGMNIRKSPVLNEYQTEIPPLLYTNPPFKLSEYSSSFRKTFLSVEKSVKQSIKRENCYSSVERKRIERSSHSVNHQFYQNLKKRNISASRERRVRTEESSSDLIVLRTGF